MPARPAIQAAVDAVRIIDTHEHLEEESTRLARPHDWSYLFSHYAGDDLAVAVFRTETDRNVLLQDLSFIGFTFMNNLDAVAEAVGIEVGSLPDYLRVIDTYFDRHGREAVAVKNQAAYSRRLDFADVPPAT